MRRKLIQTAFAYIAYLLLFAALLFLLQKAETIANAYYRTTLKVLYPYAIAIIAICLVFGLLLGLPRLITAMREKGRVQFNPLGLFLAIPSLGYIVCYYLLYFWQINIAFFFDIVLLGHIELIIILLGFSMTMLVKKEEYHSRW